MEHTMYHKLLRVSAVVFTLMLVFDSGYLISETTLLSQNVQHYVASVVSVGASVDPTELNVMTAELTKRNKELDEREAVLADREIAVGLTSSEGAGVGNNNFSTYVLSTILFILVVLIVLNYALDYIRERTRQQPRLA